MRRLPWAAALSFTLAFVAPSYAQVIGSRSARGGAFGGFLPSARPPTRGTGRKDGRITRLEQQLLDKMRGPGALRCPLGQRRVTPPCPKGPFGIAVPCMRRSVCRPAAGFGGRIQGPRLGTFRPARRPSRPVPRAVRPTPRRTMSGFKVPFVGTFRPARKPGGRRIAPRLRKVTGMTKHSNIRFKKDSDASSGTIRHIPFRAR